MADFLYGARRMAGGGGSGRLRTASPFTPRAALSATVAEAEPPSACVGMSAAADPAPSYGAAPSTVDWLTFNHFDDDCVAADPGPPYTVFTFEPGHVAGTVGVHFSGNGTGTLTVTSTGGSGPWVETSAGDIIVNVDETSGSPFDLTATLSYDDGGTEVLSSGAANLFYA